MTGIIDYGVGNLHSVSKALAALGVESRIVSDGRGFSRCDRLILPGVGAFPDAMEAIKPLEGDIRAAVRDGVPLMGICLGMQMLFEYSDECGGAKGLGILPGVVRRFPDGLIVPHMGWSPLNDIRSGAAGARDGHAVPSRKERAVGAEPTQEFRYGLVHNSPHLSEFLPIILRGSLGCHTVG